MLPGSGVNWRSNAIPPREDGLSMICGDRASRLSVKLMLLAVRGDTGPSWSPVLDGSMGRIGEDVDFAAPLRDLGASGGSCLFVADLVFLLGIAVPWSVRSGVDGRAASATSSELDDSSVRIAHVDGGSSTTPLSVDIAEGPLVTLLLSPS